MVRVRILVVYETRKELYEIHADSGMRTAEQGTRTHTPALGTCLVNTRETAKDREIPLAGANLWQPETALDGEERPKRDKGSPVAPTTTFPTLWIER